MRAGAFDQRVTFYRGPRVADNQGGGSRAFVPITTIARRHPAQVELLGGDEVVRSEQMVATRRGIIRVRYSRAVAAITEQDRIFWHNQSRMFGIVSIAQAGMHLLEWIEFVVVERSS